MVHETVTVQTEDFPWPWPVAPDLRSKNSSPLVLLQLH